MDNKKGKNDMQFSINLDDTPILYTDNVNISANEDGVVLNITQRLGPTNEARIVARIGMSRVHAKKFIEKLGELLLRSEGKLMSDKKLIN